MFISRFLLCSVIILSSFFFPSCSDTSSPDITNNIKIIPLIKGNTWHYRMTGYDSTGSYSNPDETTIIINDTIIFNQTWYSYSDIPPGFWYTNKFDGYWVLYKSPDGDSSKDTTGLVYRYPTFPGDTYRDTKVISINEELELPLGKFKVIHYSWEFNDSENSLQGSLESYVAPGIGVVKIMQLGDRSDGSSFKVYERELKGFSLKE